MLEAHDVVFSYDGETMVLNSLSFHVQPGELVLVTGPTGSGKSTLARFLSGFIPRQTRGFCSGVLTIDGQDTSQWSMAEVAKRVALVHQDSESQICTLGVFDEVAFGPENYLMAPERIRTIVFDSLKDVGASHLLHRPTYALSGGEKQRITIAAVLACSPEYLILDEPTSSLDPNGIQSLRQVLLRVKQSTGVVCIEHQLAPLLPIADRVVRVEKGVARAWTPADSDAVLPAASSHSVTSGPVIASLRGVSFSYGLEMVLREVSLDIGSGEIVALMGDNGSGKTTLLLVLAGLLQPQEGSVLLMSKEIRKMSRAEVAERIAVVFQNPNHQIFERTVWREQTLSLEVLNRLDAESAAACRRSLESAGLIDYMDRNPFALSHGQKRRLNVSSVTCHNPRLLLLDEPFIGQDRFGRAHMEEVISGTARKGGAVVVVTHDVSFALRLCNRIVFLRRGEILMDGAPHAVVERLRQSGHEAYSPLTVD
ncbi:MAG: ABC transporter ATP-binding protein [Candidatus Thorarchaeota archaeon]|nr:ABC transporter ATP-binding protein [Candidatus Thorarchaeota archaeon]